jgi:hypothetical protein
LSCHTNELGGALSDAARAAVATNAATIPALTELLPERVRDLVAARGVDDAPVIALSLHAPAGSLKSLFCGLVRGVAGKLRGAIPRLEGIGGFRSGALPRVEALPAPMPGSLLHAQFSEEGFHHEDAIRLALPGDAFGGATADTVLALLLEGFLHNRPRGVTRLMSIRNRLVRPLGLRTSPLGCPVSSLLSPCRERLFAQRYPVLAQSIAADGRRAEVMLGADDRHLKFRSCIGIEYRDDGRLAFTMATRVRCLNGFGRLYMAAIDTTHRRYIAPTMMMRAAEYALGGRQVDADAAAAIVA